MPFQQHLRVTATGTLLQGQERFSFGLNLSDPNVDEFFEDGRPEDVVADVSAFFASPAALINAAAVLTEVKVARIGPTGLYIRDPFISAVLNVAGGASGNSPYPPQVALAVSLDTDLRGPRGRGRFYLPMPGMAITSTGAIAELDALSVRDAVVGLVNNLNNGPGISTPEPRVVVASSLGGNNDVTSVRVGRVLDTIRSRRTSLSEGYTEAAGVTA